MDRFDTRLMLLCSARQVPADKFVPLFFTLVFLCILRYNRTVKLSHGGCSGVVCLEGALHRSILVHVGTLLY